MRHFMGQNFFHLGPLGAEIFQFEIFKILGYTQILNMDNSWHICTKGLFEVSNERYWKVLSKFRAYNPTATLKKIFTPGGSHPRYPRPHAPTNFQIFDIFFKFSIKSYFRIKKKKYGYRPPWWCYRPPKIVQFWAIFGNFIFFAKKCAGKLDKVSNESI